MGILLCGMPNTKKVPHYSGMYLYYAENAKAGMRFVASDVVVQCRSPFGAGYLAGPITKSQNITL